MEVLIPALVSNVIIKLNSFSRFFQYIVALALPVDLPNRNIFVSVNLEANYALPTNSTNFTHDFFDKILLLDDANDGIDQDNIIEEKNSRKFQKRDVGFVSRRNLYGMIEGKLELHGMNGRECLMKLICEAASSDFVQSNGFLGSIMEIILKYYEQHFSDLTDLHYYKFLLSILSRPSLSKSETLLEDYEKAEQRSQANCDEIYETCEIDVMKFFPAIFNENHDSL